MIKIKKLPLFLLSAIMALGIGLGAGFTVQKNSVIAADENVAVRAAETVTTVRVNGGALNSASLGGGENVALVATGSVSLSAGAFSDNANLYSVDLSGANITSFGAGAFSGCTNLRMVLLPSALPNNTVPQNSFSGCVRLSDVTLPDSVTAIGAGAFQNSGIVQITLPESLSVTFESHSQNGSDKTEAYAHTLRTGIGENAFLNCDRLLEVYNRSNIPVDYLDTVFGIADVTWGTETVETHYLVGLGESYNVPKVTSRAVNGTSNVLNIWTDKTNDRGLPIRYVAKTAYLNSAVGYNSETGNVQDEYYYGRLKYGHSNKSYLFRTDDGFVYCQNTIYDRDRVIAGDVRYILNNWYLGAYIGGDREDMLELPNELMLSSPQWELNGLSYDYLTADRVEVYDDGSFDRNSGRSTSVLSSYGICANVFRGARLPYINIEGRAVNAIGSGAFGCAGLRSLALGENIMAIGNGAISTDSEDELYIYLATPDTVIEGAIAGSNAARTTYFIYENRTEYNGRANQSLTDTDSVKYTYVVDVEFHINGDRTGGASVDILNGLDYNYRRNTETNIWESTEAVNLPNLSDSIFGSSANAWYVNTNWYSNSTFTGNYIASFDIVGTRLNESLMTDAGVVNLYARSVEPYNRGGYTTGYDGNEHGVTDSDDYTQSIVYTNMSGAVTNPFTGSIIDAGEYNVTVGLNGKYGTVYDGFNTLVTVNIMPRSVALSDFDWRYTTPTITTPQPLLSAGRQPIYLIMSGNTVQGASLSEPETLPDGARLEIVERRNSYVSVSASGETYTLSVSGNFDENVLTVEEDPTSQLSGSGSGRYTAQAAVRLINTNNYTLANLRDNAELGISFSTQNDGSVIISKEWYIVEAANLFMNGDTVFFVEDRAFGDTTQITNPTMQFGSPVIQFNLKMTNSDGECWIVDYIALGSGAAGNLDHYINSSMPVGNYELTLNAAQTTVDGTVYSANTTTFSFRVTEGNLGAVVYNGSTVADILGALAGREYSKAHVSGEAFKYDTDADEIIALESLLNAENLSTRNGVWQDEAYDGLYGKCELRYEIDSRQNTYANIYEGFDELVNGNVYYQLYCKNYGYLFNTSTEAERAAHSFRVIVYGEVAIPSIENSYNWIGDGIEVKPIITNTGYYTIEWRDEDYTQADGENTSHQAVLTLSSPRLYRWNATDVPSYANISGTNNDTLTLTYKINPVENRWLVSPTVSDWLYDSEDLSNYYLRAVPMYTDIGATLTFTVTNAQSEELLSFTLNYADSNGGIIPFTTAVDGETIADKFGTLGYGEYRLTVQLSESNNIKPLTDGTATFTVNKNSNSFVTTPSLSSWIWGEEVGTLSAEPLQHADGITFTVTFQEVEYTLGLAGDADFKNIDLSLATAGSGANLAAALEGLGADSYTLTVECEDTDDYYGMSASVPFRVMEAQNSWQTAPTLIPWSYGEYDENFTAGMAVYTNTVTYTVVNVPTTDVNEVSTTDVEELHTALGGLQPGAYTLNITVAAEADHYAQYEYSIPFEVSKGTFVWGETAMPDAGGTPSVPELPELPSSLQVGEEYDITWETQVNGASVTYNLYNAKLENGEWVKDGEPTSITAEELPNIVGMYIIEAVISSDELNALYGEGLTVNRVLSVEGQWRGAAESAVHTASFSNIDNIENIIGESSLNGAPANTAYTYSVDSAARSARAATDYDTFIANLKTTLANSGVGTYTITITATSENVNFPDVVRVITLTLSQAANSWAQSTASERVTYGNTLSNSDTLFVNAGGIEITYSISENSNFHSLADIANLDAGTYTVNVSAEDASGNWSTVTASFILTVTRAENVWTTQGQINAVPLDEQLGNTQIRWSWDSDVSGVAPVAGHDATVSYEIDGRAVSGTMLDALLNLGTGSHTLTITAAQTTNYESLVKTVNIYVSKATITISNLQIADWTYGNTAQVPSVTVSANVEVIYTYQRWVENEWVGVALPTDAGSYRVKASADETDDYESAETEGWVEFEISRATPQIHGVTASNYAWSQFNWVAGVFAATSDNPDAIITYAVYRNTEKQFDVSFDGDALASDTVTRFNALTAGSYILMAESEQTANYSNGSSFATFTVNQAPNIWVGTPTIRSWVRYEFNESENLPNAYARYGVTHITITNPQNAVIFQGARESYLQQDGSYSYRIVGNEDYSALFDAAGGLYTLRAWVDEQNGCYDGREQTIQFEIFTGSNTRPQNRWTELPAAASWTSEFESAPLPEGEAERWTRITHDYYRAERNNGTYTLIGDKIATVTKTKLNAQTIETVIDGDLPAIPSLYVVVFTAYYTNAAGEEYEGDRLEERVPFYILQAVNNWETAPTIESWTLDKAASTPTNGVTVYDSVFDYKYKAVGEDDSTAVATAPTAPGRYEMITTAYAVLEDGSLAQYCEPIISRLVFNVSLASNNWITLPTIADWSEEFEPNSPEGEAEHGTIVYRYYKGNELLDEKPTAYGTYRMVAVVEEDGYETLYGEVEFTITPAWDETLMAIDIVLGVLACAVTVVAIIFAKRRKSQC